MLTAKCLACRPLLRLVTDATGAPNAVLLHSWMIFPRSNILVESLYAMVPSVFSSIINKLHAVLCGNSPLVVKNVMCSIDLVPYKYY